MPSGTCRHHWESEKFKVSPIIMSANKVLRETITTSNVVTQSGKFPYVCRSKFYIRLAYNNLKAYHLEGFHLIDINNIIIYGFFFFFCTIAAEMFGKTLRRQTALVQLAKVGTEIDQYSLCI